MGLNSRQGGGGDLPSLDLAFALDKTLTARKGPTPAFTRSSTATFVGSNGLIQSAAINVPRFDHDPVTGVCKGLLIEESRTNLATWSQEFEKSAGWDQTTFAIVTANQIASPSGAIDADLITTRNTSFGGLLRKVGAPAYAASTTYTMSVYAKAGTHQFLGMRLSSDSSAVGGNSYSVFTLSGAGSATAVTPTAGTINSVSCVNVGNGWYRCVLSYTTASTAPASTTDIAISQSNGNVSYTPTGTETVYLWGAQLEVGAFPTSYIPTTIGTAARSADVCSIIGTDFSSFYNQAEGTTLLVGDTLMSSTHFAGRSIYSYNNGSYASTLGISKSSGGASIATGGNGLTTLIQSLPTLTSQFKSAVALATNGVVTSCLNTSTADVTGTFTGAAFTRLTFHDATTNGAFWHSGHIARIQYFRKRLSNEKLQTLTTS